MKNKKKQRLAQNVKWCAACFWYVASPLADKSWLNEKGMCLYFHTYHQLSLKKKNWLSACSYAYGWIHDDWHLCFSDLHRNPKICESECRLSYKWKDNLTAHMNTPDKHCHYKQLQRNLALYEVLRWGRWIRSVSLMSGREKISWGGCADSDSIQWKDEKNPVSVDILLPEEMLLTFSTKLIAFFFKQWLELCIRISGEVTGSWEKVCICLISMLKSWFLTFRSGTYNVCSF